MIQQIKQYVMNSCAKSENVFGEGFFEQHILIVVDYATRLADVLGGDREVVELSAFLHDISAIRDIGTLANHAAASSEIAGQLLSEAAYPSDRINIVKQSILTHSFPIQLNHGLVEEVCVSNADAMSQIVVPAYWLYFAFCVRKLPFSEGRTWLKDRVESNWEKLINPARELIQDEYIMVKKLLL